MRLRMRKEEVTRGQNVATRIRQFETANNNNNNDDDNDNNKEKNNNSFSSVKRTGGTPNGFGSASRYSNILIQEKLSFFFANLRPV